MISVENLTHGYGARTLFSELNWQVVPGSRCALVGPNGAGKTTLLRILAGGLEPDSGAVRAPKGARVGYLPQEGVALAPDRTILDTALEALGPLRAIEAELAKIHAALDGLEGEEGDQQLERAGALQHRFEELGGYAAESETSRVLAGLGFEQRQLDRPVGELSGGWQMRVALGRLMLEQPDVLLLDEPTNHLDIESVAWLERELLQFSGATVIVTHDRYLLERLATRVVELQGRKLEDYAMNYRRYVAERSRRREAYEKARLERDRHIDETEAWIERFRYKSTKARQVQSRVKQLEHLERMPPLESGPSAQFRFPAPPRSGRVLLEAKGVGHGYGENEVLRGVDLTVERGDRIGIVGVNGVGKSTLLRLLAGVEQARDGNVKLGHQALRAYLAQDQSLELDPARTVYEELAADAELVAMVNLRTVLGAFLFRGDDIDKKVEVLSGGEKGRLGLAKLLLRQANVLLLDEPTNHLDMTSRDILVDALRGFGASVVLVSHDRSVLDRVCTKVIYLEPGKATLFPGTWSEFEARRAAQGESTPSTMASSKKSEGRKKAGSEAKAPVSGGSSPAGVDEASPAKAPESAATSKARRRAERRCRDLEDRIRRKEARVEQLEASLADPEFYRSPNGARYTTEYQGLREELKMLYGEWEDAALEAEG